MAKPETSEGFLTRLLPRSFVPEEEEEEGKPHLISRHSPTPSTHQGCIMTAAPFLPLSSSTARSPFSHSPKLMTTASGTWAVKSQGCLPWLPAKVSPYLPPHIKWQTVKSDCHPSPSKDFIPPISLSIKVTFWPDGNLPNGPLLLLIIIITTIMVIMAIIMWSTWPTWAPAYRMRSW